MQQTAPVFYRIRLFLHCELFHIMHLSFVVPAPTGTGNSAAFNFSVFKALLNALHCGDTFMVKSLLKGHAPPEVDKNVGQQMTWAIWINFLPLSHGSSTWNLASIGPVVSKKIFEHTHTHTHILQIDGWRDGWTTYIHTLTRETSTLNKRFSWEVKSRQIHCTVSR